MLPTLGMCPSSNKFGDRPFAPSISARVAVENFFSTHPGSAGHQFCFHLLFVRPRPSGAGSLRRVYFASCSEQQVKTEVWAAGPAEALTAFKPLACAAPVSVLVIIGLPLDLELNCQTASGLAWPVLSLYPIRRSLSTPKSALGHIHLTTQV